MAWLKLDDGFVSNGKIVALTDREFRIWVRTLCHCARAEDPTVDAVTVREVVGLTPKICSKFAANLLLDRSADSYEIHDWIKYLPKDKTGAERQARWRARRRSQAINGNGDPVTEPLQEALQEALPESLRVTGETRARGSFPVPKDLSPKKASFGTDSLQETPSAAYVAKGTTPPTLSPDMNDWPDALDFVKREGWRLPSDELHHRLIDDYGCVQPALQDLAIEGYKIRKEKEG